MRSLASMLGAVVLLLVLTGPALAADPTHGAVREYAPGTQLAYRFGTTYPDWLQSVIQKALTEDWTAGEWNNSRLPYFLYSWNGAGAVYYSSSATSPCGTGNTQWLQCASGWGSASWRIYIRNFSGAPYSNWHWCNTSYASTCWDLERALVHEAEHVTMGVAYHDSQGESNTVMGAVSPWYPNYGWQTRHIQRCDEAAAQLLYGMGTVYGQLADCFENVPGHGTVGLIPSLTASTTIVSVCASQLATLSGRFSVAAKSSYQALSGAPLGLRKVWFDRKPRTSSVWTLNVTSASTSGNGAWSRAFSTSATAGVTYDFRPHVSSETGLDAATGPVITVTWRSGC